MWETTTLRDICSVFDDGDWIETKHQSDSGIRLIQTGNIKTGFFSDRIDKARYISEDTFASLKCIEVFRDDILVSRLPEPVGRACIIPPLHERAITAVDCTIIRVKKEKVIPEFLNYYMQSPSYFASIRNEITGSTRLRISRKKLGEIPVILPPLVEQKRIVAKLDAAFAEIDNVIEAINTKETEIRNLQASLLGTFLIGNSEKWNKLALQGICSFISRGISPKYTEAGGVRVLNQKCIRNHLIDYSLSRRHDIAKKVVKQERFIKKGDVLINSTGHGTLGRVAQVRDKPEEPTTVDSHITIVRPMAKFFHLDFFGYAAIFIEDEIKASGQGTSGQTELSRTKLKEEFYISFPTDFKEQQIIVTKLDSAYNEFKKANEAIIKSKLNYQLLKSAVLAKELQSEVA